MCTCLNLEAGKKFHKDLDCHTTMSQISSLQGWWAKLKVFTSPSVWRKSSTTFLRLVFCKTVFVRSSQSGYLPRCDVPILQSISGSAENCYDGGWWWWWCWNVQVAGSHINCRRFLFGDLRAEDRETQETCSIRGGNDGAKPRQSGYWDRREVDRLKTPPPFLDDLLPMNKLWIQLNEAIV